MNRWQLIQDLFEETAGMEAGERARILGERAPGDADLARTVEALAAAEARPLAALDGTAANLLIEMREEPRAEELCGRAFGSYCIEEHLSSGGMAHVYRAKRLSAGTERRVAFKVMRPALSGAAFLERFERERRTLAALEHEHIVSFLDAGTLPDERPFLVMEFVDGVPLLQWGREMPLRRRLELFLKVLGAVQYAHQRLVVHQDLKPMNVLVTPQGAPKLLDFGVATVLEGEGVGAGGNHGPLTPDYASPEQLRGEAVTTASDIYSLGVLLHELVSGELPEGSPNSGQRVRGDLGAIVDQALAADPRERYRSADHMADDLRRFLASEPISARPATALHRARLYARRHRGRLMLAAAVVLALIAGWVGSNLARLRAEKDASRGWGAHAQVKAAARLYEDWIASVAAADVAFCADAAAHLEEALRTRLSNLPETETLVRIALARLYLQAGDSGRAAAHANRALELGSITPGVGDAELRRAEELRARAQTR